MASLTLLDIAKKRGASKEVGLIESVATSAPEIMTIPARTISGTSYKTLDRNSLPTTGFTKANAGITPSKSGFDVKTVETFIFRGAVNCDKMVADAWEDGATAFQAIEAEGVMRSAVIKIGRQIYYGVDTANPAGDPLGFPGLRAINDAQVAAAAAPDQLRISATGTSSNAATSVYGIKYGPQFVQMIYGMNQGLKLDPFRVQSLTDANGGQYTGYVAELGAWVGLQCVNPFAVGRICNLTTETNKGLTDALLADLLARYPVGFQPDAWYMTRQSRLQLQKNRAVVLQGNGKSGGVGSEAGLVAPVPTEAFGIPIIVTDSIVNTEAVVA